MISYQKLKCSQLFSGMSERELEQILHCLSAQARTYGKGEFLFHSGDAARDIGVVLEGSLHLSQEDYWGNRSLLARVGEYEAFGETFACRKAPFSFDIVAAQECRVLFLDVERVLTSCSNACQFHQRLVRNLLTLLAEKNLELSQKAEVLAQRTIRSKLMEYLSGQARRRHAVSFDIPFNRQQLADYLSVDRSAMTVELGKMAREGILRFEKNHFELL